MCIVDVTSRSVAAKFLEEEVDISACCLNYANTASTCAMHARHDGQRVWPLHLHHVFHVQQRVHTSIGSQLSHHQRAIHSIRGVCVCVREHVCGCDGDAKRRALNASVKLRLRVLTESSSQGTLVGNTCAMLIARGPPKPHPDLVHDGTEGQPVGKTARKIGDVIL